MKKRTFFNILTNHAAEKHVHESRKIHVLRVVKEILKTKRL